jgi:tRNA(Arg) A34 adenosine deaminase TadA
MAEHSEVSNQAMKAAIKDARQGALELRHGGPFGAAVILNGQVISVTHNTVIRDNDPTCHAEVNAIREACRKLGAPHLEGAIVIATSEPCPMCLTTCYWAHVAEVRYCLPHRVATEFGFDDSFIYEDLKIQLGEKVQVVNSPELTTEARRVFEDWREAAGKLY